MTETRKIDIENREVPYGAPHHTWKLDDQGRVDTFILEWDDPEGFGGHSGPGCSVCNKSWCHHCEPNIYEQLCPCP